MDIRTRYNVTKSRWFCCLAWVWGHSLAGVAGSNPAGVNDVCFLWIFCVVPYRSLQRADPSCREVFPSIVCLSMIMKPREWGDPGTEWKGGKGCHAVKYKKKAILLQNTPEEARWWKENHGHNRKSQIWGATWHSSFFHTAFRFRVLHHHCFNPCPAYVDNMASSYQC